MNKPSRFPQAKPSPLSAQERVRKQSHLRAIQPKIAISAQKMKQPVAPPVYRPQPIPRVLQRKAEIPQTASRPMASPLFRPQPTPKVLKAKTAASLQPQKSQLGDKPSAPPVRHMQPTPKVLQKKSATAAQPPFGSSALQAPPVHPFHARSPQQQAVQRTLRNQSNPKLQPGRQTSTQNSLIERQQQGVIQPSLLGTTLFAVGALATSGILSVGLAGLAAYSAVDSIRYHMGRRNYKEASDKTYQVSILESQTTSKRTRQLTNDHITIGLFENDRLQKAYGLWVKSGEKDPFSIFGIPAAEVRDDTHKYQADYQREFKVSVTKTQYNRIKSRIEKDKANPPRFDYTGWGGHSCVTWVQSIMHDAGLTLENGNWILPPSPQDLGQYGEVTKDGT